MKIKVQTKKEATNPAASFRDVSYKKK